MKWLLLGVSVVFLSVGCGIAPPGQHVEAAGSPYPSHVNTIVNNILAQERKTWRKDAVATLVEMQWYPQYEPDETKVQHWLAMTLYSPSNGAGRYLYVGGPYDGQVVDTPPEKNTRAFHVALPDFKFDLPQAIDFIRRQGLKDRLSSVKLEMVGAAGTTPIPAWTISSFSASSLYPIVLDAQTGAVIPWQRAFNPPPFTDEEMRAAWDRVLNRNQPKPSDPHALSPFDCVAIIQQGGDCL
jgi:hypothetical protein